MSGIKKIVGTLKYCSGKHQFVKLTFCNCVNKCVMKPIIMKQVSKKPLIYCEFENKLIECKYCDTICDASKSELMFLFPSQIA
jgi:hypothetical protein